MKVLWAGLILFVVMTGLASAAFNIVDFGSRPPPEGWQIFTPRDIIVMNTALLGLVTLPATLLMMLAAWFGKWRGPIVGLASILAIASAWGLGAYLDMALSPSEIKRGAQWDTVWWYLGGLAYVVPSYLVTYFILRRTLVMAPLFVSPTTKSTALP